MASIEMTTPLVLTCASTPVRGAVAPKCSVSFSPLRTYAASTEIWMIACSHPGSEKPSTSAVLARMVDLSPDEATELRPSIVQVISLPALLNVTVAVPESWAAPARPVPRATNEREAVATPAASRVPLPISASLRGLLTEAYASPRVAIKAPRHVVQAEAFSGNGPLAFVTTAAAASVVRPVGGRLGRERWVRGPSWCSGTKALVVGSCHRHRHLER